MTLEKLPHRVLHDNFHITISSNYRTPSLVGILLELGADCVLFAADYPFEDMADAAEWFDTVPISESDRRKIAPENARRLPRL